MDITPMIDITFLLLIFFLVCSTMSQATSVKLPPARHGKGVDEKTAVIITIDGEGGEAKPLMRDHRFVLWGSIREDPSSP